MMKFRCKKFFYFAKFFLIFFLIIIWIFSGWPQIWNKPSFPPKIKRVQAATISAFPGTTAGAQDTTYASDDCTDNMAWDGTGTPGNASASDNSYIAEDGAALDASNVSDELQFSNFGIVIPGSNSTIDGVLVEIERHTDSGEVVNDAHVMITTTAGAQEGNDKSAAAQWATTDPDSYAVSFGGSTDTWGATGGLTETEVEGSGFGVVICVKAGSSSNDNNPKIDALRITVYYTLLATGAFNTYASSTVSFNAAVPVLFTSQTSTLSNVGAIKIEDDRGTSVGWTLDMTANDWKSGKDVMQLDYNGQGTNDNLGMLCAFPNNGTLYAESGSLTGVSKGDNECFNPSNSSIDLVTATAGNGNGLYWLTDMSLEQYIPSNPTAQEYTTTIIFTLAAR